MRRSAVALALLVFGITGCLSDIRPDVVINQGINSERETQGREVLKRLAQAHGGRAQWQASDSVRMTYRDHWQGWLNIQAAMPWPENGQKIEQVFRPLGDDSRLIFLGGPDDGKIWGIQNWMTYTQTTKGPVFEDDGEITFWLPTVAYFVQAPFRLVEADVVSYAGQAEVNGRSLDIVFLSWGTDEPQSDTDQYIAWVDRESGRLVYLEYTIRDMMGFLTGCMAYQNYEEINGIWLAQRMATVEHPGGPENLHVFEVEKFELGVDIPDTHLVPKPNLKRAKP